MTDAAPVSSGEPPRDPREELAELVASVRAYAEWQAETGAEGLPLHPKDGAARQAEPAAPAPVVVGPRAETLQDIARVAPLPVRTQDAPPPAPAASVASSEAPKPAPSGSGASGAEERKTRLALIAEEVRGCTSCVLHAQRKQTVFERGDPFSEVAFIGEGPGADEDATGIPFVGPAGQLLDRMIAAMGYDRDEVYVCNIVKCRPPSNRKPEVDEMASCMPFLTRQIGIVRPRVIVALGATAVQGLCGTTEGITRLRGKWKLWKGTTPIMPTFHPAYLLRNPAAKREVWLDLQEVMKHIGKALPAKR